jgi:hypothetical protein
MIRRGLMSLAMLAAAAPIAGAEVALMPRPESCMLIMTVQKSGCEVANVFRCNPDDPEAHRTEISDTYGLSFIEVWEPQAGGSLFGDPLGQFQVRLPVAQSRSTSIPDILAQGKGITHEVGTLSIFGVEKPLSLTGTIRIDGPTIAVTGVPLTRLRAEETLFLPEPMDPIDAVSYSYVHEDSGVVVSGEGSDPFSGSMEIQSSGRPMAVDFPGGVGFGSTVPAFDCGEFSAAPLSRDKRHEDKT